MKFNNIIFGAAYTGVGNVWGWIPTLVVIGIGVLLFWGVYKLILSKIGWAKEKQSKGKEMVRKVIVPEEEMSANGMTKLHEKEEEIEVEEEIVTSFAGRLMSISEVPDPIFSEKMVGDGFAIEPSRGEILAPVNGQVTQIHKNKDSITFKSNAGRDVILHIGINTSNLQGEGICFDIKEGHKVYAGQKVGSIDLNCVVPKVSSIISPIVFPGLKENERIVLKQTGLVEAGMKGVIVIEADRV